MLTDCDEKMRRRGQRRILRKSIAEGRGQRTLRAKLRCSIFLVTKYFYPSPTKNHPNKSVFSFFAINYSSNTSHKTIARFDSNAYIAATQHPQYMPQRSIYLLRALIHVLKNPHYALQSTYLRIYTLTRFSSSPVFISTTSILQLQHPGLSDSTPIHLLQSQSTCCSDSIASIHVDLHRLG